MMFRAAICAVLLSAASATTLRAEGPGGFEKTGGARVTVAEQIAHPELWLLEAQFKKMRMVRLPVTDPRTGRRNEEAVWYMVFKLTNRDLERPEDNSDTIPVNVEDPSPTKIFQPQFTLVTNDNDGSQTYHDVILPEVQRQIERRERIQLHNPTELIGTLPQLTAAAEDDAQKSLYGVAIWRNIDPRTDFFSVYMSGICSAYQISTDAEGRTICSQKTVVQDFWRPGDEVGGDEREIRFKGEPRWVYRPTAKPLDLAIDIEIGTPKE